MNKNNLTIDASVAIKWLNNEPHREEALKIRESHIEGSTTLHAPTLLIYEVCNALRYNPEYDEESLLRALGALQRIGINYKDPDTSQLTGTVKNAYQCGLSAYDSSYLACSESTGSNLVTADEKLYNKAKDHHGVILLAEFNPLTYP